MANINRDYLVVADLKSGKITSPAMSFYNTDKNIANLFVKLQITMSTNPSITCFVNKEEASNYNVKLTVVKPKTTMLVDLVGVIQDSDVMGNGAVYLFDMPQNFTDQVGRYICELEITCMVNGREEVVTCDPFEYSVKESVITGLNAEIESNPDTPVLKQLIDEVRYLQENGGSIVNLSKYQKMEDNKLATNNKTVVGGINELNDSKVDKVEGKGLSTVDFTKEKDSKLNGIAENANNYTHPINHEPSIITQDETHRFVTDAEKGKWNNKSDFSGSYNDLTEKPNIPSIEGLATEEYVGSKVAELVNSAPSTLDTLQELATALGNDPNFATTVANQIGTKASNDYVNAELAKKVNSEGYVATENNYSTAEKTKLANVEEGANNYVHPENHEASIITQDNMHRFITDAERQTWNNKSDFDGDYNKLSNKPNIPMKVSQLQNDSNFATETFVTTKVEEISMQIKCSYLGLTPLDDNGNNHQLLCDAINMGKSILVDGTYELKTESIGLITKNIDIKGITPDAKLDIQFDSFTNGIFKTNGNIDISIKNIKFTSTLATKIINMANPIGVLGFVEIEGCKFENKMRIFDFVANGSLDPSQNFYGFDTFIFNNNIVTNGSYTAIVITDAQYNNVIISDNTINNLSNLFAIISVKNESVYSEILHCYRHRTTITNNYVYNNDECYGNNVTGSYYAFIVLESDYVYYARNHVEGMKTLQDVVCYDIYASSREVVYENNMWKNIIAINPTGSQFYQGTSLMMAKGNNGIRTYRNNTFILEKSFVEKMGKTVNDVKLKLFNNTSNTTWNIEDNKIDVCRLDGQTSGTNANVKFCGNTLKVMNWGNGTITNSSVGCFNIIKDNNIEIKNIITDFQITGCYIKQSEPVLTNYVVTNNVFNITSSKHLYLYDKVSADKSEISNNTYHCNVIGDFGINYDAEYCNLNNLISCGDKWITNKRPRAIYRQLLDIDEYSSSIEFTDILKQESREHLSLKKMNDMPDGFRKTYVWTIEYFTGVGWQSSTVSFKLEKVGDVSKIIFIPLGESTPQSYDLFSTQGNSKKFNFLGSIPYIATLFNSLDNPYIYFNHIKGAELSQKHYIIKHSIKALSGDVQYVTENMGSGTGLTAEQTQQLQQAHTHSTSPHAPSNAQRNSDITKEEIETKLTGDITTHTHQSVNGIKLWKGTQQQYTQLNNKDNSTLYIVVG
ncbi:hypothetical protein H9L25_00935 [Terrisporobacter mayombei]|nr:hypothetical protein [Terrisporobacter mayombei]